MTKKRTQNHQSKIKRFSKEGRGQGTGPDYKPWARVQDKPSLGLVSRLKGWKTGRVHHFFNRLELDCFFWLEWQEDVVDIREHYPLDIAGTTAIAAERGLRHPRYAGTKQPSLMTTDFVITRVNSHATFVEARTVMSFAQYKSSKLSTRLKIERFFWEAHGVEWQVVTELDIPRVFARNVELLHNYQNISDRVSIPATDVENLARLLTKVVDGSTAPLRDITRQCDRTLNLTAGTSLAVALHLIAIRRWKIDMNSEIHAGRRLMLLGVDKVLEGEN